VAGEEIERHAAAAELRRAVPAQYRRTTLITAWMYACSYGAASARSASAADRTGAGGSSAPAEAAQEQYQRGAGYQEIGGLVGRIVLAILRCIRQPAAAPVDFPGSGLILVPWVFCSAALHDLETLKWGVFFADW